MTPTHAETLKELAGYLLRTSDLYPRGSIAGEENDRRIAACQEAIDALALVPLVRRWKAARLAVRDAEDPDTYAMAEQVLDVHEAALLAAPLPRRHHDTR